MSEDPVVPNQPDSEPPLTDHEENVGKAYVYGYRACVADQPFRNPYYAGGGEGQAWRSGYLDAKAERR